MDDIRAPTIAAPVTFTKVDHACRHCASRILQSGTTFSCASCGAKTVLQVSSICGCGIAKPASASHRAAFRCIPNPDKCDASPAEIVIAFGEVPDSYFRERGMEPPAAA